MIGALLAHVDAIGITPAHVENRGCHQPVVEHHVRLLHQAQSAKSEQIGIARAGANQIDLAQASRGGA